VEKKFVITITKTAVVPLYSKEEAEDMAKIFSLRECIDTMAGNLLYVTTDVKELEYAN
jgi:hypothetical protein